MLAVTYTNTMPYEYDATHSGAHYLIGGKYKNNGEFAESVAKYHRDLDYLVNPATSYDNGSDIESLNASVKSSGASLARLYGNSKEEIIKTYFANVHSTLWIYVTKVDEEITEYHMNAEEFNEFLTEWGETAKESGTHLTKVRLKKESKKMLRWLEARV